MRQVSLRDRVSTGNASDLPGPRHSCPIVGHDAAVSLWSIDLLGRSRNAVPLVCTKSGSDATVTPPSRAGIKKLRSVPGTARLATSASWTRRLALYTGLKSFRLIQPAKV